MERNDAYYEERERQYESGEIRPDSQSGPVLHGAAAVEAGQRHLMWATETDNIEDAVAVALGRPRLEAVPNEIMRVRVPQRLMAEVRSFAKKRNTTVSQVVREAMGEYVQQEVA